MRKLVFVSTFVVVCLGASAGAQIEAPAVQDAQLPAVEAMDCAQMQAEMTSAGQLMNQQMDPNLGADIQAMQDDSQRQMSQARTAAIGSGLLCAVPGLGLACTVAMNAQTARQAAHAEENRERMDAVTTSMQDSTAGIDLERMTAVSQRWEEQRCEAPR
jgi:hypothetical protein